MKIIERAATPDGVEIYLEDWREEYGYYLIGAYPIAKNSSYWVHGGRPFRLSLYTDDPQADFDALKAGARKIEDMADQFHDQERGMYYLGMKSTCPV